MAPALPPEGLLTTVVVAALLRVHPKHVYRLRKAGLPALRVGGEWRFDPSEVRTWAERRAGRTGPASDAIASGRPTIAVNEDPAMDALLVATGSAFASVPADSGTALELLSRGLVLAAGVHGPNVPTVIGGRTLVRVHIARRDVGLVSRRSRRAPKLENVERARLAGRPPTSGARAILDAALRRAGFDPARLEASEAPLRSNRDVACGVARGEFDLGFATRAWAERIGLAFASLDVEPYAVVFASEHAAHPAITRLCATVQSASWRRTLRGIAGYEGRGTGDVRFATEST